MYLGFQSAVGERWDIARCHVPYDGKVNMKYRYFGVTDHHGYEVPYFGGLDEDITPDKYQNWVVHQRGSNSTCEEDYAKCVFNCMIAREFTTEDVDDFNFESATGIRLNAAYQVYYKDKSI